MNELTDMTNKVNSPEQAVTEFIGEQFIEWVMGYVSQKMQALPAIQTIISVHPRPEKIKKFMLQTFLAAEAFFGAREGDPGFLRFAIANLSESDDPQAEGALEILEKKRQDEMTGLKVDHGVMHTAHRELWIRLLHALDFTDEEINRAEPKEATRNFIAELSDIYSSSDWQTAVGAFAAHERAGVEEYKAIYGMLKSNTTLADKDMEILSIYIGSDSKYVVNTSHILDKIVFDLETKNLVWDGIKRQLEVREEFLNSLVKYLEN